VLAGSATALCAQARGRSSPSADGDLEGTTLHGIKGTVPNQSPNGGHDQGALRLSARSVESGSTRRPIGGSRKALRRAIRRSAREGATVRLQSAATLQPPGVDVVSVPCIVSRTKQYRAVWCSMVQNRKSPENDAQHVPEDAAQDAQSTAIYTALIAQWNALVVA